MNLYRTKPSSFRRVGDRYSRFFNFDHFMGRDAFDEPWIADTSSKIRNGKNRYKIDIALPGFTKKDIQVAIHNDTLSVQIVKNGKGSDQSTAEDIPMKFGKRYYTLPKYLDQEGIQVKLRDGILKIRIPYKDGVSPEKKKITVS